MKLTRLVALVAATPLLVLAACTTPIGALTPPAQTGSPVTQLPVKASAAVMRAQAAYDRIKPFVDKLAPMLPAPYADRLNQAQVTIEQALAFGRLATSATEQLFELRRAEAALKVIEAVTGAKASAPAG